MSRERIINDLEVEGGGGQVIEVRLDYDLGGMNYFTGSVEPRGIYLCATPVTKSEGWRSFTAFAGTKVLYKELKRFSQKVLDECQPTQQEIDDLVNHVLAKNNLKLVEHGN
jgi:hypothetical protein